MKQSVTIGIIVAVIAVAGIGVAVYMEKTKAPAQPTATVGEEEKVKDAGAVSPSDQEEAETPTAAIAPAPTTPSPTTPPPTDTGTSATTKSYTMAEVAKHNTEADCWLAIGGMVYAVSPMIQQHPGSAGAIIPNCGKDATQVFATKGKKGQEHSPQAKEFLAKLAIGTVQQ